MEFRGVTSMPEITTEWQRFEQLTAEQLYELLRFRQNIFVVEQRSPYPDLDGLDQSAWHLLARVDGELAGCLRLIEKRGPPPLVSIGRGAVASHLPQRGVGRRLMREALEQRRACYKGHGVALSGQTYLVPFYDNFGFSAI